MRSGRPVGRHEGLANEAELVRRAQAGDAKAFGALYDACVDPVYRYVFFRVTNTEEAEDLTSEVFLKAWQSLGRYKPNRPFMAWLYTIARNTVIDHYRTTKVAVPIEKAGLHYAPDMDSRLEAEIEAQAVKQGLQQLTPEQQEVLMLRFIEDLETDEIAERMRRSQGAIRALQMRALQALERNLTEQEGRNGKKLE